MPAVGPSNPRYFPVRRWPVFAVAVGGLLLQTATAQACTCGRERDHRSEADAKADRLARAQVVARLRIKSVIAGTETTLAGRRVVKAAVTVEDQVKGSADDLSTVVTLFGAGDCGIASALLVAVAGDRPITLELKPVPDSPGTAYADMCGYGEIEPLKR